MLTPTLIQQAENQILNTLEKAEAVFRTNFPIPSIHFDVKDTRGGFYRRSTNTIHLNPFLYAENQETFLKSTIPHEIGHLVNRVLYPIPGIKPHGPQWKSVMIRMGLPPIRCHSYDVSKLIKRRQVQKFIYSCSCNKFHIGKNIHTKILLGKQKRQCLKCHQIIIYTGEHYNVSR